MVSEKNIIKNDSTPIEVIDNLYIGSFATALEQEKLEMYGIKAILVCGLNMKEKFKEVAF